MVGGSFIGMGALVSIPPAGGVGTPGTTRLLEGFGFSAGFFFVILSEAVLFSEANVMMPAALLENRGRSLLRTLLPAQPGEEHWDNVWIVRYPSRRRFLELLTWPGYAEAEPYRSMALEHDLVPLAGDMTIPESPPLSWSGPARLVRGQAGT
jgi:hypothetical protein